MHIQGINVIKVLIQTPSDLRFQINQTIKDSNFLQVNKFQKIFCLALEWILTIDFFKQHEMSINS